MILPYIVFIALILLLIFVLFFAISGLISIFFGAPLVSSRNQVIIKAIELAGLKPNQTLLDLGCGIGNVLKIAKEKFKADVIGYEIAPFPYLVSKLKYKNIYYKSIKHADFAGVDLIYIYLLPGLIKQISPKLIQAVNSEKKVVTISFGIIGLAPYRMQKFQGFTIRVYKKQ